MQDKVYQDTYHVNPPCISRSSFTVRITRIFTGEKLLRISQLSRKIDPLRSNYCILAKIVCNFQ